MRANARVGRSAGAVRRIASSPPPRAAGTTTCGYPSSTNPRVQTSAGMTIPQGQVAPSLRVTGRRRGEDAARTTTGFCPWVQKRESIETRHGSRRAVSSRVRPTVTEPPAFGRRTARGACMRPYGPGATIFHGRDDICDPDCRSPINSLRRAAILKRAVREPPRRAFSLIERNASRRKNGRGRRIPS